MKPKDGREIARDMSHILKNHGIKYSIDECETMLAALRMALENAKKERRDIHISKMIRIEHKQRESKIKWNRHKKYKYRTNPAWYSEARLMGELGAIDEVPDFDIFKDVPEEKFQYAVPKDEHYKRKIKHLQNKLEKFEAEKEGEEHGND